MTEGKAPKIDVVLVAGRRPDLLEQTLASFAQQVFPSFRIAHAFANIDPIFGDREAHALAKETILRFLPSCEFFEPANANFAMAVKRLWGHTSSDVVLHLEDDWICNEPIAACDVAEKLKPPVGSLALHNRHLKWDGLSKFYCRSRRKRFLGIVVRRFHIQRFGTSPRFIDGTFARGTANLLDCRLDPEKQMDPRHNPRLGRFQQQFKSVILAPSKNDELVSDIGRKWRESHGYQKTTNRARSHWNRTSQN